MSEQPPMTKPPDDYHQWAFIVSSVERFTQFPKIAQHSQAPAGAIVVWLSDRQLLP